MTQAGTTFSEAISLQEGKHWIQTVFTLLKNLPSVASCLRQSIWENTYIDRLALPINDALINTTTSSHRGPRSNGN